MQRNAEGSGPTASIPLTKFRAPRVRPDMVARPDLLDRLTASIEGNPVTLVCAPGGSGKTTLLSQFAANQDRAGATVLWIAIDAEDDDANRLFSALVHVVEPLELTWDTDPRALIASVAGSGTQSRTAIAALVNALCTAPAERIVLVLDDLHRIEGADAFELLESLIERLPEHVALVLGSRIEPPLPLARWRAHGELGDIGPADLRFSEAEAVELATSRLGVEADAGSVRRALNRTHGWAVGLSMALQSRTAPVPGRGPNGADPTNRVLFAYLAQEVLAELPPRLGEFALRAAILDELDPDTCVAVTGMPDSAALLDGLYGRNLFLTAIDESGTVLRFHDLFRDFLEAELARRHPEELPALHERAARATTMPSRAVHHFLAARRWADAAEVIVEVGESLLAEGGIATLERWIAQLPRELAETDPHILALSGHCAWLRWDWALARQSLEPAVQALTSPQDLARRVRASFQLVDALNSSGDRAAAREQLEQVGRLPLDELGQAELALQRAWCVAADGELAEVEAQSHEFLRHVATDPATIAPVVAGRVHCTLIGLPGVAIVFERFAALCDSLRDERGAPWHIAVLAVAGWAALWRGERSAAVAAVRRCQELNDTYGSVRLLGERVGQLRAMLATAMGDTDTAIAIATAHIAGLQAPEVAWHRGVWLRSYYHAMARMHWLAGNTDAWREICPRLIAPRTLVEWPFTDTAAAVARGQAATLDGDWPRAIEIFTAALAGHERYRMPMIYSDPHHGLAWALLQSGDRAAAWRAYEPVYDAAVRESVVGPLLLENRAQVNNLLDAAPAGTRRQPDYLKLRERLADWEPQPLEARSSVSDRPTGPLARLTEREREVLACVAVGSSNKHIARDLDLSLHTVKRHIANILDKLDCASRGQAASLYHRETG